MTDWSPGGDSFSISDQASSSARLERAYRRLLACYPRSFRRESTEEVIAVLLASVASTVSVTIVSDVAFTLFAIAVWLFLAWANGKGSALARVGAIIACAVYGALTIQGYAQGDANYAPVAAIVASSTVLVIGVAAVILLLMRQSWPYYTRPATAR